MKALLRTANAVLLLGILLLAYHLHSGGARGREELPADVSHEFVRGDSNDDALVDLSDAIFTLSFLFRGGDPPDCLAASDMNDDAQIDLADGIYLLNFLFIGGEPPASPFPGQGPDPTPDELGCRGDALPPLLAVGSPGGPDRELDPAESILWRRGRQVFDHPFAYSEGLGPFFNGDSCRGCHLDPTLGGSGGLDVDVVRFARISEDGTLVQLEGGPAASRHSIRDLPRDEHHPDANIVETRQTPTVFGLGLLDRVPDAALLANADPDDLDGDGISGRPRMVGARIGRFGHKAGVPSLKDFAADGLLNELGITVDPRHSAFAGADSDSVPDPELPDAAFEAFVFFLEHVAPPARRIPGDPLREKRVAQGEATFVAIGCGDCHRPELAGPDGPVRAYTDLLLHDVADPARRQVDEPGVEPREFRTAPLWGLRDTAPYLHDGSAESVEDAIVDGHHGEAQPASSRFQALSFDERSKVLEFLNSL